MVIYHNFILDVFSIIHDTANKSAKYHKKKLDPKKVFCKKNWTHYMKIGHHRWILKQNTDTAKICKINNL